MRTVAKRDVVEAEQRDVEAAVSNDFYRRTSLNRAVGMTSRHPWAFRLSEAELERAEVDVREGNPPIPWLGAANGLRVLVDPSREMQRRREREGAPAGDRRRYIEGKYAELIQH